MTATLAGDAVSASSNNASTPRAVEDDRAPEALLDTKVRLCYLSLYVADRLSVQGSQGDDVVRSTPGGDEFNTALRAEDESQVPKTPEARKVCFCRLSYDAADPLFV